MRKQGNQKHLTFEQRVDIEKGLTENKSFTEIGRIIGKNPSTISKEVRLHAHTKERPDSVRVQYIKTALTVSASSIRDWHVK